MVDGKKSSGTHTHTHTGTARGSGVRNTVTVDRRGSILEYVNIYYTQYIFYVYIYVHNERK